MSLVIRLSKMGKRGERKFRIFVAEKRSRRDGKPIEMLGFYERGIKTEKSKINRERIMYWIANGAKPSEQVSKLIK